MFVANSDGVIFEITLEEYWLIELGFLDAHWIEIIPYENSGVVKKDLAKNLFPKEYEEALKKARQKFDDFFGAPFELELVLTLKGWLRQKEIYQEECSKSGNCRFNPGCPYDNNCTVQNSFQEKKEKQKSNNDFSSMTQEEYFEYLSKRAKEKKHKKSYSRSM